jgi:hypothetical protein
VFSERDSLYGTPIWPTAFFDGTDEVFEPDPNAFITTYTAHITAAKADTPRYNLELMASATTSAADVQIMIVTTDTIPEGQMLAFVAICQDSVRGALKDFNYVCEELHSFPLELSYPDTLDTAVTFSHAMPIDKMRAVVFIQNMDTKEIMHSVTKKFEEVK